MQLSGPPQKSMRYPNRGTPLVTIFPKVGVAKRLKAKVAGIELFFSRDDENSDVDMLLRPAFVSTCFVVRRCSSLWE